MSDVREYRKGITYRTKDMTWKEFRNTFKFSEVAFDKKIDNDNRKRLLNKSYDALMDLANLFMVTPDILSLQDKESKKPGIIFGKTNMFDHMCVEENGNVLINWIGFLDRFMALSEGMSDSLSNNVSKDTNGFYAKCLKETLQKLKLKQVQREELYPDVKAERDAIINSIYETMNELPDWKEAYPVDYLILNTFVDTFRTTLDKTDMYNMFNEFEARGLEIDADVKRRIVTLQGEFLLCENKGKKVSMELVETYFYRYAKSLEKGSKKKYSDNLHLLMYAANYYVAELMKKNGTYNNFLVTVDAPVTVDVEDSKLVYDAMEEFFLNIMSYLSEEISYVELEDEDETEAEEEVERNNIIDEEVKEDVGKFKLTLFKKMAKEAGFNPDMGVTEKSIGGCYYITFKGNTINYVRPAIFNHPKDKKHKIDIYCGADAKKHFEYWFDYELDYEDFIKELKRIENENKVVKTDEKAEVTTTLSKFRLTDFKTLCQKNGLAVLLKESQVLADKYYRIDFDATKGNIKYIIAPIQIDGNKDVKQRIEIKLLSNDATYFYWNGALNYNDLLKKLIDVNVKKVVEPVEEKKEQAPVVKPVDSEINEKLLKAEGIEDLKSLRDRLGKIAGTKIVRMKKLNVPLGELAGNIQVNLAKYDNAIISIGACMIPDKELKGNSKAWDIQPGGIAISSKADYYKQYEALIEAFVNYKMSNYKGVASKKLVLVEGLTYTFCKLFSLDVRTYCKGKAFQDLLKSGDKNIESYLRALTDLYNKLFEYVV